MLFIANVITFRLSDMRPQNVNRYLADVIPQFADQLESGALMSVDERAIRARSLPVAGLNSNGS